MPDRFWVGGSGTWDGTSTTNWSATSGGAGGASAPTSADDVYLNANSGAATITIGSGATGRSLICTGFTGTIAGSAQWNLWGGLTLVSGMSISYSGTLTFSTTDTTAYNITTAGKSLSCSVFFGNSSPSTGSWTLQDALTTSGSITVNRGTFTTNNFSVTATALSSSNSNTRTINLGSSTITLSSGTPLSFLTNTGLTFNAGTSTFAFSGTSVTIVGGPTSATGVSFYNVQFTGTNANTNNIQSANTFNNLTITAPSTAGVTQVTFDSPQTINGTLSTTGTAGNRRVWFRGFTYGLAQTLTINSAPSLTDADFRDIYVVGTAAPISGTRIGDLRGNRGITFSTPKTVYWNQAAGGNWSGTNWAATAGGAVSDANFPLAQDTAAIVNTGLNTSATVTMDAAITYVGTVDMSARTSAMNFTNSTNAITIYGDWKNGSGTTLPGTAAFTFSGRNTQTITSAGKSFGSGITIDSYGGTVQLADALNIGTNTLTVTNGTFNTQGYAVTANAFVSNNSNVRTITLGASTLTFGSAATVWNTGTTTGLTFNAGTSTISVTSSTPIFTGGGLAFYNLSFTVSSATTLTVSGPNTFNNLTLTAPASAGLMVLSLGANQTITGTLTVAGASPVRRIFLRSDTLGTTRTLTVNSLSATDCDFRDITLAGAAAGSSPTRAGDCGGNTGITFPAPKTVYWNLAGPQNWSATAWASSSGGTPAVNNFPLAQDVAVFDDTGSVGSVNFDAAWNVGTINAGSRTTACNIRSNGSPFSIYGNWLLGTGAAYDGTQITTFLGRGTQTITSSGNALLNNLTIDNVTGTVQLADAFRIGASNTLTITSGTFDAVTYNVTAGLVVLQSATLRMGSGTWTLSGSGSVWSASGSSTFIKGTANIVLSSTSTSARTFAGGNLSYNKLTIGGTTGTSTLTITGNNQFTELASTKTVAHTIALGTTSLTLGAWTVSGSAGNVVTVSGTATITIAGARVSGVDYLALGTTTISATSPGEFYAGANSTGGTNAILTAAPAPVTRYWRGGTGTWDATTTTNWSATSGGAGGASVPTSADAVIFDSASNATAYTVTCIATQLRCGSLTMAGPASGNVTWAGTAPLAIHGNVSLSATGITRTYTGAITLSGSSIGRTFTTNGVALSSDITVNGVGCGWTLGSAASFGATASLLVTNGTFDTGNFDLTVLQISSSNSNDRTINFGSSTVTLTSAGSAIIFTTSTNLTFNAGTSNLVLSGGGPSISGGGGVTFNNVSFTSVSGTSQAILGANTFNNLSFTGRTSAGITFVDLSANQTVNGTLTLSAGTNATMRTFVRSDTIGTTRTLTCAAVASLTDIDFRDITIAGAAAPVSGTRLGDCKGNSGITFDAGKTVYYRSVGNASWGGTSTFSATNGGAADPTMFPLAQDTTIFPSSPTPYPTSGNTVTLQSNYNIGTIDMSARTSNTMTLATGTNTPTIYGNWINGTGTTLTGTGIMTFSGRGSQTITSAGRTFTQGFTINTPGGSVTLQDAFITSTANTTTLTSGTFDANGYNFTSSGLGSAVGFFTAGTLPRTLAIGSGTWSIAGSSGSWSAGGTNLTVTGTGTISLTSASAKTFAGGGISYSGITLDQGGAGALTVTGNNIFKSITNTYSATGATSINLGTTTQMLTQPWAATGAAGRVLTVAGTSAAAPATLIYTGAGTATTTAVDYLAITGVRAYDLTNEWYAGANSTNNGSLGWIFEATPGGAIFAFISETSSGTDAVSARVVFRSSASETATGTDTTRSRAVFISNINESGSATDLISALRVYLAAILESASGADSVASRYVARPSVAETGAATDAVTANRVTRPTVSESATVTDLIRGGLRYLSSVSETATASDVLAAVKIILRSIAESAAGADATSVRYTARPTVAESATATDRLTTISRFVTAIAESGTATDVVSALRVLTGRVAETATASDIDRAIAVFRAQIAEGTSAADAIRVAASTFNARVTETATETDVSNTSARFRATATDTATGTETVAPRYTARPRVAETATGTETVAARARFTPRIAETATISDQPRVAPSVFNAIALAVAQLSDQVSPPGSIYNAPVLESATVTDSMIGAYLWNLIDDSQTPGWQNIGSSQNAGWNVVDDSQNPGWTTTPTL